MQRCVRSTEMTSALLETYPLTQKAFYHLVIILVKMHAAQDNGSPSHTGKGGPQTRR